MKSLGEHVLKLKCFQKYSSPNFRLDSSCWHERWLFVSIPITSYRFAHWYCLIFLEANSPVGIELPLWGEYEELALQKLNKYSPFSKVIEENGWGVDQFAVEVGAQGYSSKSLPICLDNKIVQKTTKSFSCISMKAPFYIWHVLLAGPAIHL